MAKIKPFKGIRPPKQYVEEVESRPYDVLDSEEARVEAGDNEKSLYHIIKPEIDFEPGTSEYDPRVYEKAAENFKKFGLVGSEMCIRDRANMIRVYTRRPQRTLRNSRIRDGWFRMIRIIIISMLRQ